MNIPDTNLDESLEVAEALREFYKQRLNLDENAQREYLKYFKYDHNTNYPGGDLS